MEQLLSKVTDAGMDPSSVAGEEALILWEHIRLHIASTNQEKAHCYIISAEYRSKIKQLQESIEELRHALDLLKLPEDVEDILSVKSSLSDRLVEKGDYNSALTEYIASTNIAVEYGYIDEYVLAIIGMGNLCDAYGDHNRALRYYQKIDAI
ncbi:MAG: GGDEF domain-containing protein, partial [Pseudomonadota bacterium]